jgi:hypothetical protein
MPAGDYELRITNPNVANGYAITVPPGQSFWSADGYALGNVYHPSYRAYFTVPKNTQYIQMIAKPTGTVGIAMYSYDSSGVETSRGAPIAKGNNVYQLEITPNVAEDTLWAVNLKGDYWSDIRLLTAPQIMSFNKKLHATMVPSN